ncbi:MAG: hypothetical protein WCO52_01790 [bacterium]
MIHWGRTIILSWVILLISVGGFVGAFVPSTAHADTNTPSTGLPGGGVVPSGGLSIGGFTATPATQQQFTNWLSCNVTCNTAFKDFAAKQVLLGPLALLFVGGLSNGPAAYTAITTKLSALSKAPTKPVLTSENPPNNNNTTQEFYNGAADWVILAQYRQQSVQNHWRNLLERLGAGGGGTGLIADLVKVKAGTTTAVNGFYFDYTPAASGTGGTVKANGAGKQLFDDYLVGHLKDSAARSETCGLLKTGGSTCEDIAQINQQGFVLGKIYTLLNSPKDATGKDKWRTDVSQIINSDSTFTAMVITKLITDLESSYAYLHADPANLQTLLKDGSVGVEWTKTTGTYTPYSDLGSFYTIYQPIRDMVISLQTQTESANGATPEALTKTLTDAAAKVAAGEPKIGTVTGDASSGPCGGNGTPLSVNFYLRAICNAAVIGHDIAGLFINTSALFLADSADMIQRPQGAGTANTISAYLTDPDFLNFMTTPIEQQLIDNTPGGIGALVQNAYNRVLQFLNVVLVLGLVLIALANLLQIQVNTYAINKLIPALIIGFIVAHFSFFGVRASLEVVGQLTRGLIGIGTQQGTAPSFESFVNQYSGFPEGIKSIAGGVGGSVSCLPNANAAWMTEKCQANSNVDLSKIFKLTLLNIFTVVAAVMLLIVAFLMLVRRIIFYVMVPMAPLAAMGAFFSPLEAVWKRWWGLMKGWLIMPLAAGFWIWLSLVWASSVNAGVLGSADAPLAGILGYAFGIVCLYFAIKTPFSLAGEAKGVLDKWNEYGRNAANRYTPAGTVRRGYGKVVENMNARNKMVMEGPVVKGALAKVGPGKLVNRAFARSEAATKNKQERLKLDEEELMNESISKSRGLKKQAADIEIRKETLANLNDALKEEIKTRKDNNKRLAKEFQQSKLDKTNAEKASTRWEANRSSDNLIKGDYQQALADLESEKEIKTMSDANWMEGVRTKKNESARLKKEYLTLRKEGITAKFKAEQAETAKTMQLNNFLKNPAKDLTDPVEIAEAQKEAETLKNQMLQQGLGEEMRAKGEEKTQNEQALRQQKVLEYSKSLKDLFAKDNHTAEDISQMRHYTQQLKAIDTKNSTIYDGMDTEISGMAAGHRSTNIALLGRLEETRQATKEDYIGLKDEELEMYEKRIGKKSNGYIKAEGADSLEQGKLIKDLMPKGSHTEFAKLLGGDTADLKPDVEVGFHAFTKGLQEGKLEKKQVEAFTGGLRNIMTDTRPEAAAAKRKIEMAAGGAANVDTFITRVEAIGSGHEGPGKGGKRDLWNKITQDYDVNHINMDKQASGSPSLVHNARA